MDCKGVGAREVPFGAVVELAATGGVADEGRDQPGPVVMEG